MKLRILHTQQLYFPRVGGSEEMVKQLSERLALRGHAVTVATAHDRGRRWQSMNGVRVEGFHLAGNSATGIRGRPSEIERYQRFVQDGDFDVMLNSCAQIWSTDLVFSLLPRLRCGKVLAPSGYSGLGKPIFRGYFENLPAILRQYDHIIYFSANYQDKHFGDAHGIHHFSIIPNAASEDEFLRPPLGFRARYEIRTKHMLLSVGNHYAFKGHRFVIEAFRRLGRSDTTLVILGHPVVTRLAGCYPSCRLAALHPRIKVLTVPRPWVVSAFQEADLFVFGSRVEASPLVILEAMAAGIPFVTTNCGNVLDLKACGRIVESPSEMAREVSALLENQEARQDLGGTGHRTWRENHTWENVVDQYEQVYRMVARPRNGAETLKSSG